MTEQTDLAPDEIADAPDAASAVQILRREPSTVAEALDIHARLSAVEDWLDGRKRTLRDWTKARAEARKQEDGGAPTWRFDDGTVGLTDPQPTPRIVDAEAFARWWLTAIEETDPDLHDDAYDEFVFETSIGAIARRRTATASSDDLLTFLRTWARTGPEEGTEAIRAAERLAGEQIRVDVEWLLSEDAIGRALTPKQGGPVLDDGTSPRLTVVGDHAIIDRASGEEVPGTDVAPPGKASVQFRPTTETKDRLGDELTALLGPSALTE